MIQVSIPSKGRPELLMQTLQSIADQTYPWIDVTVSITSADDIKGFMDNKLSMNPRAVYNPYGLVMDLKKLNIIFKLKPYHSVIQCQNEVAQACCYSEKYYFLPTCDDVLFSRYAFEHAVSCLRNKYPTRDGVVGFRTINMDAKDTSIMLIGWRYLRRFPYGHCFFPEYKHFGADTELGETAKRFGLFAQCPDAHVKHLHPGSKQRDIDYTHVWARRYLEHDLDLLHARTNKKLLWGEFDDR